MKKILWIMLVSLLYTGLESKAGSTLGGAILYNPVWNTHYEFHLFLIRDCSGPSAPDSLVLQTSVPGIPAIWVYRVDTMHLNDLCLPGGGSLPAMNCQNGDGVVGLRYSSRPVDFTQAGLIPLTGFKFSYTECCRAGMDNINGTPDLYLVARMYPFFSNGGSSTPLQNADATPLPVNLPEIYSYVSTDTLLRSFQAIDFNGDDVHYDFILPWMADSVAVSPASGYSQANPFSGALLQQGDLIEEDRGLVKFSRATTGRQSLNLVFKTYRCGQMIAVTQLEFPQFVNPLPTGVARNTAPVISIQGGDQQGTLYLYPRDTMIAEITAMDTTAGNQTTVSIYLPLLQTSLFSLPGIGCNAPPCLFSVGRAYNSATFMLPQPILNQSDTLGIGYTASGGVTAVLSAVVDCNQRILGSCLDTIHEIDLLMTARDGRCEVNNRVEQPVRIRMMELPHLPTPNAWISQQNPATLVWGAPLDSFLVLPGISTLTASLRIQRSSFVAYEVYRKSLADTSSSPFTRVAILTDFNQRSWVDSTGNASYYIRVVSGCDQYISNPSPVVVSFATALPSADLSDIRLYPNPSDGLVSLENGAAAVEVRALDLQGRELYKFCKVAAFETKELDLQAYPGVVLLELKSGNAVQYKRLVVIP